MCDATMSKALLHGSRSCPDRQQESQGSREKNEVTHGHV